MKKRCVGLFLVLTMIAAMFATGITAAAEDTADIIPDGWTRYSGGANSSAYEPYSYTTSSEEAYEGTYSLKVKQQTLSGVQLYLANSSTSGYEKGEYTVSLYVKGSGNPCLQVRNGSGTELFDLQYWYAAGEAVTRTDMGDGWYKFEKTVTLSNNWGTFHIMVYNAPGAFYIDNISIVKSGGDKSILENGDFEPAAENSYAANTIPYDWYRTSSKSATEEQTDRCIELTDTKAYSGKNSIRVKQQTLSGVQFYLRNDFSVPVEVGTYTFSMLVKGESAPNVKASLDGAGLSWDLQYWYASGVAVTRSEVGGGWYKFEKTFTTEKPMTQFNLMVYNAKNEFYIDDVTIVKDGGAENIIENGSFEKAAAKENTYPENTIPTDAKLYSKNVENYQSGNYYTVTDEDAYDGSNALKIYCSEAMSGKQISLTNAMTETETGDYDISFYLKGTKNPHINLFINGFTDSKFALEYETAAHADKLTTSADGWRKYSFTQSVDGSGKGLVIELFSTADVLIDNITVTKHGEDENLLTNGSFEDAYVPDFSVTEVYVEDYVNYNVSARNNKLEKLGVMLTLATYTLDDDGNWVLYKTASDSTQLSRGEHEILSVPFDETLIPQDEDRYRFRAYVWDTDTLMPYAEVLETIN